jgi:hypothetical protein
MRLAPDQMRSKHPLMPLAPDQVRSKHPLMRLPQTK